MNITYKQWNGEVVTKNLIDFPMQHLGMHLTSLEYNCGLCYFSGTENFDCCPNKEELLEAILSTAEFHGFSAVIFSFNTADQKDKHQVEAIQMLQEYPGASVCSAYRTGFNSLLIITVPVVPVL